jgi:hypothetical protein
MKFILFVVVSGRGTCPRLPDFSYNEELQLWVYQGRTLTADEFNEASARVFHPNYRNKSFTIRPKVIAEATTPEPTVDETDEKQEPATTEEPKAPEETTENQVDSTVPDTVETTVDESAPAFILDGDNIMLDGERVGGVFPPGPHLRVARGRTDLRPALEAWFTQTFPTP